MASERGRLFWKLNQEENEMALGQVVLGNLTQIYRMGGAGASSRLPNPGRPLSCPLVAVNTAADLDRHYAMTPSPIGGKSNAVWHSFRSVVVGDSQESRVYGKTSQHLFRNGESSPWIHAAIGDLIMTFADGNGAFNLSIYSQDGPDGKGSTVQKTLTCDTYPTSCKSAYRDVERTVVIPKGCWVKGLSRDTSFVVMTQNPASAAGADSEFVTMPAAAFLTQFPDAVSPSMPVRLSPTVTPSVDQLIADYAMGPHPEGGYVSQFHDSAVLVSLENGEARTAVNAIYYLVPETTVNKVHRIINGDESWTLCSGGAYEMTLLSKRPDGTPHVETVVLGKNLSRGEVHSITVPQGTWMTGKPVDGTFSFVAIVAQPGFTLSDFEAGTRSVLSQEFPAHIVSQFEERLFPEEATSTINADDFSHLSEGKRHPNEVEHARLMQLLVTADIRQQSPEQRFSHYAKVFTEHNFFTSSCGGLLIPSAPTVAGDERLIYLHDNAVYSPWHQFRIVPGKPQVSEVYRFIDGDPVAVNLLTPGSPDLARQIIQNPGDAAIIPAGSWFSAEIVTPLNPLKPWSMIVVEVLPKFDAELNHFPAKGELESEWPQHREAISKLVV